MLSQCLFVNYRRKNTIVILAEYAAPKTRRSVSLEKNANTNAEPEISDHFISHLQVSQISKIKSK